MCAIVKKITRRKLISCQKLMNSCILMTVYTELSLFLYFLVGTNNARLAAMLRQLAIYHHKDAGHLFTVRLAQGLAHLGKGTLTLSPFHSDRTLMHPVVVAGLLASMTACLDSKNCKFIWNSDCMNL